MRQVHDSTSEVPITQSGSIVWQAAEVEQGTLYVPGDSPSRDMRTADILQSDAVGPLVGSGNAGGRVYEAPDERKAFAPLIKEFQPVRGWSELAGHTGHLPSLRANLMLTDGLARIDQREGPWAIQGVRVFGALVLRDEARQTRRGEVYARWLVQRIFPIEGVWADELMPRPENPRQRRLVRGTPLLPAQRELEDLYRTAITTANGSPVMGMGVIFDGHGTNTLIEQVPLMDRRRVVSQGTAVRLGIRPYSGFDY